MDREIKTLKKNQSMEKGLAIIEHLAQAREPMRLCDISEELELNRSTALRYLTSLMDAGYVLQDAATQRYFLTLKLCRIANMVSANLELRTVSHPFIVELYKRFHETVIISSETNRCVKVIDQMLGTDHVMLGNAIEPNTYYMHSTAFGKVMMLNYSDSAFNKVEFVGLTQNTVTSKEEMLKEVARVRMEQVAYDIEENEWGICSVACPVFGFTGAVTAGIGIVLPISRFTAEYRQETVRELKKASEAISLIFRPKA